MANLPMEEIEKMVGSRYALTVLAGKRARELRDGAPRLVNTDAKNPIIIALQEIYEGRIVAEGLDGTPAEVAAAPESLETTDVTESVDGELPVAVSNGAGGDAAADEPAAETVESDAAQE